MAGDADSGPKARKKPVSVKAAEGKPANAFVTARKGFCYLTIRQFGRNHEMMRIRAYKIEPDEKRHMRRLYPDVAFDWRKITQQLAEKREDCRRYRSQRQGAAGRKAGREDGPLFGFFEPSTRTVFTNGIPSTTRGVGQLLDAILQLDRGPPHSPMAAHNEVPKSLSAPDAAASAPTQPARRRTRRSTAGPSSTK